MIKEGKADLEAVDHNGRTAVSHAAKYGSVDCLNLLGNSHADILHKDREGKTPLQIAEGSARTEAVTALKKWQQVCTHAVVKFMDGRHDFVYGIIHSKSLTNCTDRKIFSSI